ncbi:hypothetical protein BDV28DRAFT_152411 [Aspergillus coremiiformis]|uniref:Uncharacterized protein n=1 Tax=Aspergillus coremiiformis TaxID=138285 RepID=A0A5N6YTW7_9EURO|nr:hypothetical protein BDV28DRAFT_152411 [Aspergillus coremiiformis]
MTDRGKDQESQTRSEEKQMNERPRVRLPFVSSMPGNAWSQMRARERERRELQELEFGDFGCSAENVITRPTASFSSRPTMLRNSSGLDYDERLALPMPRPKHPMAESSSAPVLGPILTPKQNVVTKSGGVKKQACTEPTQLADNAADTKSNGEKKKSIVATLKAKLSFKELGKEFRKAQDPPLSAMPRLPSSVGNPQVERAKQSPNESFDFNEAKLYIPKPRDPAVHSASAPAETTTFRDSASVESSKNSASSCPARQARDSDKLYKETPRDALEQERPRCKVGSVEPMTRLETVMIGGSSPLASTGDTSRGHPAVVEAERRCMSIKLENESASPSKSKTDATSAKGLALHTPSTYSISEGRIPNVMVSSPYEHRLSMAEQNYPLIVSSDQERPLSVRTQEATRGTISSDRYSRNSSARSQRSFASVQPVPTFEPTLMRLPFEPHIPMEDSRSYSGVTSHGGYAPPPPIPGYQNTVTLEQQIATYMDSIHIHVDGTANKLARSFENMSNWSTDQILRQTEGLWDILRTLSGQMMNMTEALKEMQRAMIEMRGQLNALQREQRQTEDRMMQSFQGEFSKLRRDINVLGPTMRFSSLPYNSTLDTRSMNTKSQGSQNFLKWGRDDDRQQQFKKNKPQQIRKEEVMTRNTDCRRGEEHSHSESDALNKHAEEATLSDDVPTPTAAFRTPSFHSDDKKGQFTQPHPKQHDLKDSDKLSTGSPESNLVKGKRRADNNQNQVHKASTDTMKFPAKMGIFHPFRRARGGNDKESKGSSRSSPPAQRNNDDEAFIDQKPKEQGNPPSTPPMQTASLCATETAPSHVEISPSSIHPALRNAAQRRIMAERERERERLNAQTAMTSKQLLRSSRSYQDLGSRSKNAASLNWIDSPPGSPSESSSRRQIQQNLALGYPPVPAAPSRPSSGARVLSTPFDEAHLSQSGEIDVIAYRGPTPPPRQSELDDFDLPAWYRAAYAYKALEKD